MVSHKFLSAQMLNTSTVKPVTRPHSSKYSIPTEEHFNVKELIQSENVFLEINMHV
jgi:hypothetical protein